MLPFVVLGELRAGFAHGRRQAEHERIPRRLLLKDGVRVLFADDQTTHHYASLFRQLRKQGTPIPTNDMLLAALVLQHNLALHARDEHFEHLAARQRTTRPPELFALDVGNPVVAPRQVTDLNGALLRRFAMNDAEEMF